jgi:acetoin utilization deacetylase AcuC-like enzyme
MGRLAYIFDPLFIDHDPGPFHPERPERLRAIQTHLQKRGFFNRVKISPPLAATRNQLCLIHTPEYVDHIFSLNGKDRYVLDIGDTILSSKSVEAAKLAAGAITTAVDLIFKYDKVDSVFAAVRPPGHHAEIDHAKGFCIFNNIAVGTAYALDQGFVNKVLIVDWDLHHGNGTQNAFYNNSSVLYLSTHQYPFFPGTGRVNEKGGIDALGYTINHPLTIGQNDEDYINLIESALEHIETFFKPDLVCISAGFDAHYADPIGSMQLTNEGFYKLIEIISRFAQKHCNGKIISTLEGGYDLSSLGECVYQHVMCLLKH